MIALTEKNLLPKTGEQSVSSSCYKSFCLAYSRSIELPSAVNLRLVCNEPFGHKEK